MEHSIPTVDIPLVRATRENVAAYGLFIGTDVVKAGLTIPFYKGAVEEGHNLPFECPGEAVIRTARISRRPSQVVWLERHLRITQLFVGLGDAPFAIVLVPPSPSGENLPDIAQAKCFVFPSGHGIMLHKGTWHDFPLAIDQPVTCLTANSPEIVEALCSMPEPAEMDKGDVLKIHVETRFGKLLRVPV